MQIDPVENGETQNHAISAGLFLDLLRIHDGDPRNILLNRPQLARRFIGEYTPLEAVDSDIQDSITAYSAKFSRDRVEFKPGMTLRTRGAFAVADKDGQFELTFRSGFRGDIYNLGQVDEVTAQSFDTYGPTVTEVDVLLDGTEPGGCGCSSHYHAQLQSIQGIQSPTQETGGYAEDELVLIEGTVVEYSRAKPLEHPVGRLALSRTTDSLDRLDQPRRYSSLLIKNSEGRQVRIDGPYSGSDMHYGNGLKPNVPDVPLAGDVIRLIAINKSDSLAQHKGLALHPLAAQLVGPSDERTRSSEAISTGIQILMDRLMTTDDFAEARSVTSNIIEAATQMVDGHRLASILNSMQREQIAQRLAMLFDGYPNEMPLAGIVVNQSEALRRALYARQETDEPILSLTVQEYSKHVSDLIITSQGYEEGQSMTSRIRLLASVANPDHLVTTARDTWDRIKTTEMISRTAKYRIEAIYDILRGVRTADATDLFCEMIDEARNLIALSDVASILQSQLNNLLHESLQDNQVPADDDLQNAGKYIDLCDRLALAVQDITDKHELAMADMHMDNVQKTLHRLLAHYYVQARNLGMLP